MDVPPDFTGTQLSGAPSGERLALREASGRSGDCADAGFAGAAAFGFKHDAAQDGADPARDPIAS